MSTKPIVTGLALFLAGLTTLIAPLYGQNFYGSVVGTISDASGASIAGPALAFWLRRHGFHPTVVERAPALREGGQAVDFRGPAHLTEPNRVTTRLGRGERRGQAGGTSHR